MSLLSPTERRALLARPGITREPLCPVCGGEIPAREFARHTRDCESRRLSFVYALFNQVATQRLRTAGEAIAEVRAQLEAERPRPDPLAHTAATGQCTGCRYAWKANHFLRACPDCGHLHPTHQACPPVRRAR